MAHDISGFFSQLQIPQPDISAMLVLHEAIVPPPTTEVVSILLDIDLFKSTNLPETDGEMWDLFDTLRIRKNEIFDACITDATKRLFY